MKNEIQKYSPETLPLISYKDKPVVTTEMLAALYGTEPERIRKNFQRNFDRFESGKHFAKLEGQELRDFKDSVSLGHSVELTPKSKAVTVWFERGAARHAKMLGTDQAWDVWEKLEDFYFDKKPKQQPGQPPLLETLRFAKELATEIGLEGNQIVFSAAHYVKSETGIDVLEKLGATHLLSNSQEQELTPTELGELIGGYNPRQINAALENAGLQTSWYSVKKKDGKEKKIKNWIPTEEGKQHSVLLDTKKNHSDGTTIQQLKWKKSIIPMLENHLPASPKNGLFCVN